MKQTLLAYLKSVLLMCRLFPQLFVIVPKKKKKKANNNRCFQNYTTHPWAYWGALYAL